MATKRRKKSHKVVFVNPKRRRARRRKTNPVRRRKSHPRTVVMQNPRRRRRHRSNPAKSYRRHRRHNPSVLGSSVLDGLISVTTGAVGYFSGMAVNKFFPASMVRYRGPIIALLGVLGTWKIKNKHARTALIGFAIEGAVDGLRQNVSIFSQLSGDDAAETIMGITSQRGNPALGYEGTGLFGGAGDGLNGDGTDDLYGDEETMSGAYGSGLSGVDW